MANTYQNRLEICTSVIHTKSTVEDSQSKVNFQLIELMTSIPQSLDELVIILNCIRNTAIAYMTKYADLMVSKSHVFLHFHRCFLWILVQTTSKDIGSCAFAHFADVEVSWLFLWVYFLEHATMWRLFSFHDNSLLYLISDIFLICGIMYLQCLWPIRQSLLCIQSHLQKPRDARHSMHFTAYSCWPLTKGSADAWFFSIFQPTVTTDCL